MSWQDEKIGEREEYDTNLESDGRSSERDRLEEEIEKLSQRAAALNAAKIRAAGLLRSALSQTAPSDDKIIVEYMQNALAALEGVK
jgi:hypothetical protein